MATATAKPALPAEVRSWAIDKGIPVGVRGRISDEVRDAFNRSKRGRKVYVGSQAATRLTLSA
jgi:hypothetical protein